MKPYAKESVRHPNILIMTATITPPSGVPLLARTDSHLRLKDYEESLKFYLPLVNRGLSSIVFVENSNSDSSSLQNIVTQAGLNDQVEFLFFNGLDYPPIYGRAYGEFKLIDYAMAHSRTIKNQDKNAIFWKVTGRYIVKNICQVIDRKPSSFDIYCNLRKIPKRWGDMFLLGWTLKGYQACLHNIHHKLIADEAGLIQPEEVFIDLLEHSAKDIKLVGRFNLTPLVDGVRGSDNQNYSQGRSLWKFYLRNIGCKLFPWLWI